MDDLLILCYHAVSERWPTELAVQPRRLERQLRFFIRRGYRAATLSEALARPQGKTLVVTFDDAFASVIEQALPLLAAQRIPATVFVPTGYVSDGEALQWSSLARWAGTPFARELRCMSWDDLRRLAAEGWEIGSHTHTHRDLTSLEDGELDAELRSSRTSCEEQLQRPCRALAYPFGSHDRRVGARVPAAGYGAAVILDNDLAIPSGSLRLPGRPLDPFRLLREGVYRRDSWPRLLAKTSPLARRVRSARAVRLALPGA
jgi:peptidoglycan/xylan/chitin deacetylase (PgdA/CDA1 family)